MKPNEELNEWPDANIMHMAQISTTYPKNRFLFRVIQIPRSSARCEPVCSPPRRGSECPCGTSRDHPEASNFAPKLFVESFLFKKYVKIVTHATNTH